MTIFKVLASSVLAVAAVSAGSAFAQSYAPTLPGVPTTSERANAAEPTRSTMMSRAEVKSQLAQAEASGALDNTSERIPVDFSGVNSTKSRAAVRNDVLQAKRSGALALPGTARTPYGTSVPGFPRS